MPHTSKQWEAVTHTASGYVWKEIEHSQRVRIWLFAPSKWNCKPGAKNSFIRYTFDTMDYLCLLQHLPVSEILSCISTSVALITPVSFKSFFFLFDKLNYLLPVSSSKWSFPFNIKPSDLITPHTYVSTQPPVMMFPPLFQLILCQTIDQKLLHFLSCLISDSWQCVGHRIFSSWSWWEHSPINTSWPQRQDRLLAKEEALAACLSSAFGGHGRRTYGW